MLSFYSIQHSNATICENWAKVMYARQKLGRPISSTDAWVAATALFLNVPVVTHNGKDFESISGLTVVTEAE